MHEDPFCGSWRGDDDSRGVDCRADELNGAGGRVSKQTDR